MQRAGGLADTPFGVAEQVDSSLYRTKLEPDDMMLCVSDAFTESRGADGHLLGVQGLYDVVRDLQNRSAPTFVTDLVKRFTELDPENLQQDDATAIVFRADGSSASFANNLTAPFRLLAPVRDKTHFEFS